MNNDTTYKTLHGKDGYLFLINDASYELDQHFREYKFNINTLDYRCEQIQKNKLKYKNYMYVIFPDKSVVYPEYLPDEYDIDKIKRFSADYIKSNVNNNDVVIDLYDFIKKYKNTGMQTYSKTDTHTSQIMNLNVTKYLLNIIDKTIELPEFNLKETIFRGDLASTLNNGDRPYIKETMLIPIHNIKYSTEYLKYENNNLTNSKVENYWLSDVDRRKTLVHLTNPNASNKHKILIFGTSFSYNMKDQMILYVHDVYFIYNSVIDDLVDIIQPTYIINEIVERFLGV